MRRSKSSNKETCRRFEDEVNDYVSQPLKSSNLFSKLNLENGALKKRVKRKQAVIQGDPEPEEAKVLENPESFYWGQFLTADQLGVVTKAIETPNKPFFNHQVIKGFAEKLGGDSLECYKHMYDVRYLWSKKVREHYSKMYTHYKTIPIVFLSVVKTDDKKIKAIYLWQFNENCPINQTTLRMEIDCSPEKQLLRPHNSILLLAKFATSGEEELLDGQFLSDSRILIRSSLSGGSHLRFREYDMMDLRELAKVNPYEARVDNRFYCASKLDISLDVGEVVCEVSRIRRLAEIELLEYHQEKTGVESLPMFIKTDSQKLETDETVDLSSELFSEVYSMRRTAETVLIDRGLAKMILFKKDSLKIIDSKRIGQICSVYKNSDVFYLSNQEGKVFRMDEDLQCEDLEIHLNAESDAKLLRVDNIDYLVYLEGTKFYSVMLQKGESCQCLFGVEEVESGEEKEEPRKFFWEALKENIVFIQGTFFHLYNVRLKKFERRELDKIDLMEYQDKDIEWQFLAKNSKLFVIKSLQNLFKINTFELKEKGIELSGTSDWIEKKPTDDLIFIRPTGINENILFVRLEEPYLKDDIHQVYDMPNYLFSSFAFPEKAMPLWEYRKLERQLKEEQKKEEEYQKKVEGDMKELEELGEMKMRVDKHLKDARRGKNQEEERKEKMADLRKAIVRSGKEEGANRTDKALKDVKEEYMAMYQDLKKEKKQKNKEKEKGNSLARRQERNNKDEN